MAGLALPALLPDDEDGAALKNELIIICPFMGAAAFPNFLGGMVIRAFVQADGRSDFLSQSCSSILLSGAKFASY